MLYEWDAEKAKANLAKHGVPFELVEDFDWETALVVADVTGGTMARTALLRWA